jgi:hypothetical protein
LQNCHEAFVPASRPLTEFPIPPSCSAFASLPKHRMDGYESMKPTE